MAVDRSVSVSSPGGAEHNRRAKSKRNLLIVIISLTVLLGGLLWLSFLWFESVTIDDFVETIRSWGIWAIVASILLMVVHSFVPFPAELLACANGMVFGPYLGTLVTWTGAMLGAVIAFALARWLGRPFVERFVADHDWQRLDEWTETHGWQPLLASRFVPIIAFNLINYAAGLSRITWWQFLATTGIGILPLTAAMVVLGDQIDTFGWESWLLVTVFAAGFWFALHRLAWKRTITPLPGGNEPTAHR